MPVESRDDLVRDLLSLQTRLARANETQADAWDVGNAATRIESDAKRIAELEGRLGAADSNHRDMAARLKDMGEKLEAAERALAEERERCATEVESRNYPTVGDARRIATAIRSGKPDGKE